jgi:hypothetical protein
VIATVTAPTISAPMIGGSRRPSAGRALSSRNITTIGPATAMSPRSEPTRSIPNRRKTPATMAITIGIGIMAIARRTHPVSPRTVISRPVAKNALTTCGQDRCPNAGPTRTVPGIVQKKASGWR